MMMSQFAAELCMLLVEDQFGELFAHIFSTLQRYERLSLPRLKFYSRLTERQLQHGLAAMIQHHLVYHFTSLEDGNTYYEANPQAAYYLVRSGKYLKLIEDRFGEYAARIMEALLFLGHASVKQLQSLPELRSRKPIAPNGYLGDDAATQDDETEREGATGLTNGDHSVDDKPAPFHSTLKALASHGYILRVRDAHFQSPSDNWLEAQRLISTHPDIRALKGKKQEEAIFLKTQELVEERTAGDLTKGLLFNGVPRRVKRKFGNNLHNAHLPGANGANGHHANEEGADEPEENEWSEDENGFDNAPMEPGLVVRLNYEKLDVVLRNTRLVGLAEQDAPSTTAQVYECLLRRVEYITFRCRDAQEIPREHEEGEQYSIPIEVEGLVDELDPDLDLTGSIGPTDPSQSMNRRGKRTRENGINGEYAEHNIDTDVEDAHSGPSRAYLVNQHLGLLTQPPHDLVSKVSMSNSAAKWRIEFRGLARKLRHRELERLIESRYGDVALRVVRILQDKGKLDEKRLQEISLLPFRDLRQTLASMQSGGYVDLQEVPRDAQRQPSKTIFLWYYDPDRVCSSLLEDTYRAMSRTLQRIRFERGLLKDFLEKTERTDVKGHEEEYLTEGELERLQRWKNKEAQLLAMVSRLDDMVAVFRDF